MTKYKRTVSRIYWKDQPFTLCKSNNFKSRNKDKIPCLYWTRRDVSSYLFAVNFLSIFDIFHGPSAAAVQSHFIRPICCLSSEQNRALHLANIFNGIPLRCRTPRDDQAWRFHLQWTIAIWIKTKFKILLRSYKNLYKLTITVLT